VYASSTLIFSTWIFNAKGLQELYEAEATNEFAHHTNNKPTCHAKKPDMMPHQLVENINTLAMPFQDLNSLCNDSLARFNSNRKCSRAEGLAVTEHDIYSFLDSGDIPESNISLRNFTTENILKYVVQHSWVMVNDTQLPTLVTYRFSNDLSIAVLHITGLSLRDNNIYHNLVFAFFSRNNSTAQKNVQVCRSIPDKNCTTADLSLEKTIEFVAEGPSHLTGNLGDCCEIYNRLFFKVNHQKLHEESFVSFISVALSVLAFLNYARTLQMQYTLSRKSMKLTLSLSAEGWNYANIMNGSKADITIKQGTTDPRITQEENYDTCEATSDNKAMKSDVTYLSWHLEEDSSVALQFPTSQSFLATLFVLIALYRSKGWNNTAEPYKSGIVCKDKILIAEKQLKLGSHKLYATYGMAIRMQYHLGVLLMCLFVKQRKVYILLYHCDPPPFVRDINEIYECTNNDVTQLTNIDRSSIAFLSFCLDLVSENSSSGFRDPVQIYVKVVPAHLDISCQCWYIANFLQYNNVLQYLRNSKEIPLWNDFYLLLNENAVLSKLHTSTVRFYYSCDISFSDFTVLSADKIKRKRPGNISSDRTFALQSGIQLICHATVLAVDENCNFTSQNPVTKTVFEISALPHYNESRYYVNDTVKQELSCSVVTEVTSR